jgi:hypothetical protein
MKHLLQMSQASGSSWLILLPQLPPQPSSLRVRVWRRLQQIGAVAVKNAAYALPESETALEDFQWLRLEIIDAGGGAMLLQAGGLGEADEEIRQLFLRERDKDYRALREEASLLARDLLHEKDPPPDVLPNAERSLRQLKERLDHLHDIDFFSAPERRGAETALQHAERTVRTRTQPPEESAVPSTTLRETGKLWITRAGVYVDRLACAWMIGRVIDRRQGSVFCVPAKVCRTAPSPLTYRA